MTHSFPDRLGSVTTTISSPAEIHLAIDYAAGGDTIALAPGMDMA